MPEPRSDPSISEIVLGELRALRTDMNARLDRLVTTEAFAAEQKRVDQQFTNLGQDIVDERIARGQAIAIEATTRREADEAEILAREKAATAAASAAARTVVWFRWAIGVLAVPAVALFSFWLSTKGGPT